MTQIYRVLAQRYRPQRFSEVVEQTHAINSLENAIRENRLGSAYLFYGPRGVGKTTIARILAKRVNCQNPQGAEPCNQCSSCIEVMNGSSMDVIEIDAASNRRIEDIRELRENVKFKPVNGKKKVYIIDEVHMLTKESFNALLKTLEEPPEHILFLLATTEINKIPETILSRCQVFTFKKVPVQRLQKHLEEIARKENLRVDKDALFLIAKKGDGSVRDSLSFFEQVISYCNGEVTVDKVRELLGSFSLDVFLEILKKLVTGTSPDELLRPVIAIFDEGGDLERFVWEFLEFLRLAVLVKKGVSDRDILGIIGEDIEKIRAATETVPFEKLFAIFDEIYQIRSKSYYLRIKNSFEARMLVELTLLKLHDKLHKKSLEEIISDLNQLSRLLEGKDISEEKFFRELEKREQESKEAKAGRVTQTVSDREIKIRFSFEESSKEGKEAGSDLIDDLQMKFLGTFVTDNDKIT